MCATAGLSNDQSLAFETEVQHSRTRRGERGGNRASRLGGAIAKETAAAAGSAHFGRCCSGGRRAGDQVVDRGGGDTGREALARAPLRGDLASHFVPITLLEGAPKRHRGVANRLE